ncbi:MAG: RNA polymerase sigma factor [Anaerolineae bacterium]
MPLISRQASAISDPMADLVSRAQLGEGEALAQIVRETEQRVYNLAYRILQNRQEAEDLAQEIYLRVWRALPGFRGESKFTTWLHVIATNACLNRRRKLRRELVLELESDDALEHLLASQGAHDSAGELEPDEPAFVWKQVQMLPPAYSLVLTLYYQQQLTYHEIAEALDRPLGTIKAQLNRARRALARNLKEVTAR